MHLPGQHHKTYELGTHNLQASGSAVFPYLQVTKAAPATACLGVPGSPDKKKGVSPQTIPRQKEPSTPQKKGSTVMLPNPKALLQRLTSESAT